MVKRRRTAPFELSNSTSSGKQLSGRPPAYARSQGIPRNIANRMARRVALTTGLPSLMGMLVFISSYIFVSQEIAEIPPVITLLLSGGFFLLGLVGLSYGVLSASWEPQPGSLLGLENIKANLRRMRGSIHTKDTKS